RCNPERARARDGVDLLRPGLRALGEPVEHDDQPGVRRTVRHHAEVEPIGLDHVLARGHLMFFGMKSVATSRAWLRTASNPWLWPFKPSSRAWRICLIFASSRLICAHGSRSLLSVLVGQ